ncbi:MAG TPA: outer membrane beta-barrel protein [Caulobacteraceae bacterium]
MASRIIALLATGAAATLAAGAALADDQTPPPSTPPAAAPPAAPTAPSTPSMTGPLAADATPPTFDLGLLGHKVTVNGAITGLAQWQNHPAPGDHEGQADISNGQVFINKSDGVIQYFLQIGVYSLPDIGTPYVRSATLTKETFGPVPQGFLKIVPNSSWSIEVGKLPTLMGAEYTFSVEDMNIERGLLWNQENAVNRGVQVNYTKGKLALSLSFNDGFYSNHYSWVWGSATWTFNSANNIEFVGGGNTERTNISTFATPLLLNNEQIYNIMYIHTQGPWIIEPYIQYTHVPSLPGLGIPHDASTLGAALFVNYSFDAKSKLRGLSLPVRVEYISSSGNATDGTPNLLYGPGSNAWSVTITPTYQFKIYFIRAELSYVDASGATAGFAFGRFGNDRSQTRGLIETGVLF